MKVFSVTIDTCAGDLHFTAALRNILGKFSKGLVEKIYIHTPYYYNTLFKILYSTFFLRYHHGDITMDITIFFFKLAEMSLMSSKTEVLSWWSDSIVLRRWMLGQLPS